MIGVCPVLYALTTPLGRHLTIGKGGDYAKNEIITSGVNHIDISYLWIYWETAIHKYWILNTFASAENFANLGRNVQNIVLNNINWEKEKNSKALTTLLVEIVVWIFLVYLITIE